MRRTLTLLTAGLSATLVAALVVVAVPAEGAPSGGGPGGPLLLSRVNQAGPMTVLKTNGGFRIQAKNPKRPPLMVYTPDSMPPMAVSSRAKVENLNVDLLDGTDSSAFSPAGHIHDDRYYTESEANARFVTSSDLVPAAAAFAGTDGAVILTEEARVLGSVSLTPPTDGTVIANSSVYVGEGTAGDGVRCSITTGTDFDFAAAQYWESSGSWGGVAQLAGTRGFAVAGGTPFTVNLVCSQDGESSSSGSTAGDPSLTAIFIPHP